MLSAEKPREMETILGFEKDIPCEWFETILCSLNDGVFCVDRGFRIIYFNRAAAAITGVRRQKALGHPCREVFRSNICQGACALRYTMETARPVVNLGVTILNSKRKRVPISISTALLKDNGGRIIGGVETFRDLSVVEQLRKALRGSHCCEDIVSKSPSMQNLFDIIPTVAETDSTVLITGESGTGKGLVARAIHNMSPRQNGPFVTVNCSAIPDTLLESELFGYKAGAFTHALRDKPGKFALAQGGTIFLDEIADMSPALQAKLLAVLQEKVFEPLGGIGAEEADVRIVVATNKDLSQLVEEARFRRDLYYRINVIHLDLPPMRERLEDIPLLVDHFIAKFCATMGKEVAGLSPDVLAILMSHDYPGNVRELENIIEHAFVLCPGGFVQKHHLPEYIEAGAIFLTGGAIHLVDQYERQLILTALKRNKWNRLQTARVLGIHKTTLFRKIHRLGITLPTHDGRSGR
jgi:PAS domain S-box-containing protein